MAGSWHFFSHIFIRLCYVLCFQQRLKNFHVRCVGQRADGMDTEILKEPEQGIEEGPPKSGAVVDWWLESLQMSDIPLANDKNLALCEMARWRLNSSFCQAWTFACFFPTLPHHFIGS